MTKVVTPFTSKEIWVKATSKKGASNIYYLAAKVTVNADPCADE